MKAAILKLSRLFAVALALPLAPAMMQTVSAAELIYQPIVPGFGGSPLYDDYLINLAQLQNKQLPEEQSGGNGGAPNIDFPDISIDLGGGIGGVAPPVIVVPTAQQPAAPSN